MRKHVLSTTTLSLVLAAALGGGAALAAPGIASAAGQPTTGQSTATPDSVKMTPDSVKMTPGQYDAAGQFVADLVAWDAANASNGVTCTVTISQSVPGNTGATPAPVGYSTVYLYASGTGSIYGTGNELFSDRRNGSQPFNVANQDVLGVRLTGGPGLTPTVTVTALSWGSSQQTLSYPRMEDGLLVGDGLSIGNQVPSALYTLSCGTWTIG